jgi:hypothetical protein
MKHITIGRVALALLAATVICLSQAAVGRARVSAQTKVFPTTITTSLVKITPISGGFLTEVAGVLTSPRAKCRSGRTVKLYLTTGSTTTLKDVDLSSMRGEFGVRGTTTSQPDGFTIKVLRKRIDSRHVCAGSSLTEG